MVHEMPEIRIHNNTEVFRGLALYTVYTHTELSQPDEISVRISVSQMMKLRLRDEESLIKATHLVKEGASPLIQAQVSSFLCFLHSDPLLLGIKQTAGLGRNLYPHKHENIVHGVSKSQTGLSEFHFYFSLLSMTNIILQILWLV